MSIKVSQVGNRRYAKPGTCNQTGNKAPRFDWPDAVRVIIHRIAHHLGYTDDQMFRLQQRPPSKDTYAIFVKTLPWFPEFYDDAQKVAAEAIGYPVEKLGLFSNGKGPTKVDNRLLYLFAKPKSGKQPRQYGIGPEHPDHPHGNRRKTDLRCSVEVMRRLKMGLTISLEEVQRWSVG